MRALIHFASFFTIVFAQWSFATIQDCYQFALDSGQSLDLTQIEYSPPGIAILMIDWVPPNPPNEGYWMGTGMCIIPNGDKFPRMKVANVPRNPGRKCGSIIEVSNQTVGESVRIAGTDHFINYMTDRSGARASDYSFDLLITESTVETGLNAITVDVEIAGHTYSTTYSTLTPNMVHTFTWDGKDSLGNWVGHRVNAEVRVHSIYSNPAVPDVPFVFDKKMGGFRAAILGLGQWTYSDVHFYDPETNNFYYGGGETRDAVGAKVTLTSGQVEIINSGPFDYWMVVDKDRGEAYLFDSTGRHVQTRSTRTGSLLKTIAYDGSGRLASVTDAYSNVVTFSRPTSTSIEIQAPKGQITILTLDGSGRVVNVEDPMGNDHQVTYDLAGLMGTFQNPRGATNTFSFDVAGNLVSDSHSAGSSMTLTNTSTDNGFETFFTSGTLATQMNRQSQTATTITVNGFNRYEVTPAGQTVDATYYYGAYNSEYTSPGRSVAQYFGPDPRFGAAAPRETSRTVTTGGMPLSKTVSLADTTPTTDILNIDTETETTTINSQNWIRYYHGPTKTETFTSPVGRVSSVQYNAQAKPVQVTPYIYAPITYTYDANGRVSNIDQSARGTQITYNAQGFVSQVQNALSEVTSFTYDANGNVLTQTLPDSRVLTYTYDANGNLTSIDTAASVLHSLTYNLFDTISDYVAPVLGTTNYVTSYAYNADKQLSSVTRPDSSVIVFNYGASTGVLNSITAPEGTYTNTHVSGQLTKRVSPNAVTTEIAYSGYGGDLISTYKTSWSSRSGQIGYTYADHLIDSVTFTDTSNANSTVALTYDNDRLLTGVGNMTITRTANTGQVSGTSLGNSSETFAYDSTYGELDIYRHLYNGTQTYKEDYGRDLLGRITSRAVTKSGVTTNYAYVYDNSGRLYQAWIGGSLVRTYNYSNNSNRSSLVEGAVTTSATYDDQDRILTYGNYSFTYNARGELSGRTESGSIEAFTYAYNSMGALTQMTRKWNNAGTTVTDTYAYLNDGFGRRIQISKNGSLQKRYVYDELGRVVAEINSSGNLVCHFIYANKSHVPDYMIKSGVKYRFVHDHVGSVVMVVNSANGSVASSITYDEFGRITASSTLNFQPFGFAGGLRDDVSGLVRFGVREYDPVTGRWTSKDPILFKGDDTNLYGYVMNDPINLIDPEGLQGKPPRGWPDEPALIHPPGDQATWALLCAKGHLSASTCNAMFPDYFPPPKACNPLVQSCKKNPGPQCEAGGIGQ